MDNGLPIEVGTWIRHYKDKNFIAKITEKIHRSEGDIVYCCLWLDIENPDGFGPDGGLRRFEFQVIEPTEEEQLIWLIASLSK